MIWAEVPGVAHKFHNFLAYVHPGVPMSSLKNVSQFGPAVWPEIANIEMSKSTFIIIDFMIW